MSTTRRRLKNDDLEPTCSGVWVFDQEREGAAQILAKQTLARVSQGSSCDPSFKTVQVIANAWCCKTQRSVEMIQQPRKNRCIQSSMRPDLL